MRGRVAAAAAVALALAPAALDAAPKAPPVVVGVRSHAHPDGRKYSTELEDMGLGERINVEVQRLRDGLPNGCAGLKLFIDGVPIPDPLPESCANGRVRFLLDRTKGSDAAWHALLGRPNAFTREVTLSIGPRDGDEPWPTKVHDFPLEVIPLIPFVIFFFLLAAALALTFRLARRTALLRDPHVVPPVGALPPYSLARFQLAFWSFLTIAAFVFIWIVTEELDTISPSVLALLGIGSGTALGASLIAQGKQEGGGIVEGGTVPPPPPSEPSRTAASRGFVRDVLHGPEGLSLYRFQMLGWTLVLGVIFCASVYDGLAMPNFSPTLLALMGVSSATYLGAKFEE